MTKDDNDIWQMVKSSVKPLKKSNRYVEKAPDLKLKKSTEIVAKTPLNLAKFNGIGTMVTNKLTSVDLADKTVGDTSRLNKAHAKKLTTNIKIDATLDLHGLTQKQAHSKVVAFVLNAKNNNCKTIKIITGKGAGVLQSQVPNWLNNHNLFPHILSTVPAPSHHGGEGALIIALKKRKI